NKKENINIETTVDPMSNFFITFFSEKSKKEANADKVNKSNGNITSSPIYDTKIHEEPKSLHINNNPLPTASDNSSKIPSVSINSSESNIYILRINSLNDKSQDDSSSMSKDSSTASNSGSRASSFYERPLESRFLQLEKEFKKQKEKLKRLEDESKMKHQALRKQNEALKEKLQTLEETLKDKWRKKQSSCKHTKLARV
ncbi:10627_t:CDS:1, partial [Cetraspora pellucida]